MQFIALGILRKRVKAIRFMMADKSVPRRKKFLVIAGIACLFVCPFFPIAFIFSFILWLWILWYLRVTLDNYWLGEKTVDLSRKYRRKTIIDDVDFEVKEKDED